MRHLPVRSRRGGLPRTRGGRKRAVWESDTTCRFLPAGIPAARQPPSMPALPRPGTPQRRRTLSAAWPRRTHRSASWGSSCSKLPRTWRPPTTDAPRSPPKPPRLARRRHAWAASSSGPARRARCTRRSSPRGRPAAPPRRPGRSPSAAPVTPPSPSPPPGRSSARGPSALQLGRRSPPLRRLRSSARRRPLLLLQKRLRSLPRRRALTRRWQRARSSRISFSLRRSYGAAAWRRRRFSFWPPTVPPLRLLVSPQPQRHGA